MVRIVSVDIGIERACIDDQPGYRSHSPRRISSIRSEISDRPLCPAPAAPNRRMPSFGRCAAIASLVQSETVISRRAAS